MAYTFDSRTWEAETGESLGVQGHPDLPREFQDGQSYIIIERLCIKRIKIRSAKGVRGD